jgi:hypothetical protein
VTTEKVEPDIVVVIGLRSFLARVYWYRIAAGFLSC